MISRLFLLLRTIMVIMLLLLLLLPSETLQYTFTTKPPEIEDQNNLRVHGLQSHTLNVNPLLLLLSSMLEL